MNSRNGRAEGNKHEGRRRKPEQEGIKRRVPAPVGAVRAMCGSGAIRTALLPVGEDQRRPATTLVRRDLLRHRRTGGRSGTRGAQRSRHADARRVRGVHGTDDASARGGAERARRPHREMAPVLQPERDAGIIREQAETVRKDQAGATRSQEVDMGEWADPLRRTLSRITSNKLLA